MPNFELSKGSVECDRCGEVFTDESSYIVHGESYHGDKEEDFEEVADTYELKMDPNLTESNLRKAKKLLRETNQQELYHSRPFKNPKAKIPTKLEPHISADDLVGGLSGYNDDPNSFFYNNKNFKKGSSTLRTSQLGEAETNDEDYKEVCPDCGRTFNDPASAASHNEETGEIYESRKVAKERSIKQACRDVGCTLERAQQVADAQGMDLQQVVDAGNLSDMIYSQGQDEYYASHMYESRRARETDTDMNHDENSEWSLHSWDDAGDGMMCGICAKYEEYETFARKSAGLESRRRAKEDDESGWHDNRSARAQKADREQASNMDWNTYDEEKSEESETSNYEVDVDEYLKTGVAIQKTGGGRSELELNNEERITGEADVEFERRRDLEPDYDAARAKWNPNNVCGQCNKQFDSVEELKDHAYSLGPHYPSSEAEPPNLAEWKMKEEKDVLDNSEKDSSGSASGFDWQEGEEADNYPQKATMTDNEWEKDLKDLKTRYETENEDVGYDDLGTITTQGEEQPVGDIPALERIDFGYEKYESYPTKATETKKKKASEVYDGIIDDYDRFVPSDDEDVTEMVTAQKLQGSQSESIAKSLTLRYGVSREDALEKVYSIEVSNNDRIANTFFQKKFSDCSESEIKELKLYCGSDE